MMLAVLALVNISGDSLGSSLMVKAQFRFNTGGHHDPRGNRQRQQYEQQMRQQPKEKAQDYYKILGVSRDANDAQIKKAFKKLAIKYHPDKNKDDPDGAKAKF